jgi:hypothetical protein
MQPRFPGDPAEWKQFVEEWLIKERVDNERQWRLIRQTTALLTGLDPIQQIVSVGFSPPDGSGSGSGSGHPDPDCLELVASGYTGSCALLNGTFTLRRYPTGNTWLSTW